MDTADEQRILAVLASAGGDPAQLALATVDVTYPDAPEAERGRLREALLAAAVPHWFDAAFLGALLATTPEEGAALLSRLQRLSNVESFRARGPSACNVHEASRLPLREHLRTTRPDLWRRYAERARGHVAAVADAHLQVESLYHLFAADAEAAAAECEALEREFRHDPAKRSALCLALSELTAAGWLSGAALVEAQRAPLWYRCSRGEASQLESEATSLRDLARSHGHPSRIADAHLLIGEVHVAHGELASAGVAFAENFRLFCDLTTQDPANRVWQRGLSVSLSKLGSLAMAQGDLARALRSFTESKTIRERLAASDPANAAWQRDLSVSLNDLGDLAVAQGDLAGALRSFTESKTIAERLAASDPANAAWQRDLAQSHCWVGMVQQNGDVTDAAASFAAYRDAMERLAASDPTNAAWQRDLSVSFNKLGDLAVAQGDLAGALRFFTQSKTIRERLAASDPANAAWQRDLSVSLNNLGDLAVARGDLAGALRSFTESKTIAERLAASDPANAEWQRDLSVSLNNLGDLAVAQGDLAGALRFFTEDMTVAERLAASDPANAAWQRDLAVSHLNLYELAQKDGDEATARAQLRACYAVLHGMKQRGIQFDPQMATDYEWLSGMFGS